MFWLPLTLASAAILGVYDLCKKTAVRENAVPPVLFGNVLTAGFIWTALLWIPNEHLPALLRTAPIGLTEHVLLAAKSALVGCSWICAFFALKHLPISVAAPIRSTSPLWTVLLAVTLFVERPSGTQWVGIAVILGAFLAFSRTGREEGIVFHRNRWVGLMMIATGLGAVSALYDKHLLQTKSLAPATVQAWFSLYLVPVMAIPLVWWAVRDRRQSPFQFRFSIPAIAVTLLTADFCYFTALQDPDAMIALISPLRRCSVVIPFLVGVRRWDERQARQKGLCVAGILLGAVIVGMAAD